MKNIVSFDKFSLNESTLKDARYEEDYKVAEALMRQVLLGEDQNVKINHVDFDLDDNIATELEKGKAKTIDNRRNTGVEVEFPIDYKVKYDGKEYEVSVSLKTLFEIGYEKSHGDNYLTPTEEFTDETPEFTEFSSVAVEGTELDLSDNMKEIAKEFSKNKVIISNKGSYEAFTEKK